MARQRGRFGPVTGLVSIRGTPQFTAETRRFNLTLDSVPKSRAGRGVGAWRKMRATSPGGSLVLSSLVSMVGYPHPSTWKGEPGTIVLTYHRGAKETVAVEITAVSYSTSKTDTTKWAVTFTCVVTAMPVAEGFGGTQPAATKPTKSDVELYEGLTKTYDPKGLIDSATQTFDVWPLGDTDAAERTRIAEVIAAQTMPLPGMKVKTASLLAGRDSDSGTVTIQWTRTDSEEDYINPETITVTDPNNLGSVAKAAGIFSPPVAPGGNFVSRTTSTRELHDGATLTVVEYGLRDTKGDVEYPQSPLGEDPYHLADQADICRVTGSVTPPTTPTAPLGQHIETISTRINDIRWQHVFRYANLNSEQRIVFPESILNEDPNFLQDEDRQAFITSDSTSPATPTPRGTATKLRRVLKRRVGGTPEKWLHIFEFGHRTTAEDITMPGTVTHHDSVSMDGWARITLITADSDPIPSLPSAPLGLLTFMESEQIHGETPPRWKHVYGYGHLTSEDKVNYPTSVREDDPSDLTDVEVQSFVTSSGTPPSDPTPVTSGLKIRRRESRRLTNTPERWQHVFRFARTNEEDDIEMPNTVTTTDVDEIEGKATITQVTSSGTAPAAPSAPLGLHVATQTIQLHDTRWRHTFSYAHTSSEQSILFPDSPISTDPKSLKDLERSSLTSATSTPPADPTPVTSGLKIRERISRRLTGTPELWEHTYVFGRTDTEDDIELPNTITTTDIDEIEGKAKVTQVTSSGTAPVVPAAPLGQHVGTESEQLHATRWRHTFHFAHTSSEQRIVFPDSPIEVDPSGLTDQESISQTSASSTPPADPTPSNASLKIRRRRSVRAAGTPELWEHTYTFAWRNSEDDVEMEGSVTVDDQSDLVDQQTITVVTTSSTPSNPGTPSGLQWRRVDTKQIHGTKWEHKHHYTRNTGREEIEFSESHIIYDGDDLTDRVVITEVKNSDTEGTPTSAPAGLVLVDLRVQRINRTGAGTPGTGWWKHTWIYGRNTSAEEIERRESVTALDPNAINSTADVVEVFPTAAVPAAPAAPSPELQLVSSVSQTLNNLMSKRKSRFDVNNSEQEIEFAGSSVEFNQFDNITQVVETVEDNSSSLLSIATTMAATHKADKLVEKFSVRRLTPSKVVKRVEYIDGFQIMDAESSGGVKPVNAILTSGGVQVYVSQVVRRGDDWWVKIEPQWVWGAEITFRVRQRRNIADGTINLNISKTGTRNSDTFLGIEPGYVTFLGTAPHTNRNIVSPHVIEESHYFKFTSHGLFTEAGITMGWLHTSIDCSSIVAGSWVDASFFGWGAAPLPSAAYGVILTT